VHFQDSTKITLLKQEKKQQIMQYDNNANLQNQ